MQRFPMAAGLFLLAASLPAMAAAQDDLSSNNVQAEEIPMQPLRDLNLDKVDLPPLLIDISNHPYAAEGLVTCQDIEGAIADIDTLLGPDIDVETETSDMQKGANSAGRIAKSFVGGLIPFRSLVREVTGARAHARHVRAVVESAMVRRGFLKGLGLQRGCAWPARPSEGNVGFDEDMHEVAQAQQVAEASVPEQTEGTEVEMPAPTAQSRFRSEPVVQPHG